jgi:DNA-binding NtrC family response regulator
MAERVLLVDDEAEFVDALAERMRARGMEVATSTSAEDALALAADHPYDVVVLDLKMPGMDGLEALKALKARQPNLQVILLTGHATIEKGIEAMKIGATDFLEKPTDVATLTERIKKAQTKKMILVEKETEQRLRQIMAERGW